MGGGYFSRGDGLVEFLVFVSFRGGVVELSLLNNGCRRAVFLPGVGLAPSFHGSLKRSNSF